MKQRVLVTGSKGFIGRNLVQRLSEQENIEVLELHRATSSSEIERSLKVCDVVVHLAGANRPVNEDSFQMDNVGFMREMLGILEQHSPKPIIFSSSTQADLDNAYGRSKRAAELLLREYSLRNEVPVKVLRLPNVFGKWSRPHYNSVVATFIHVMLRGEKPDIVQPERVLYLLYIDDLVESLITDIKASNGFEVERELPIYRTTVRELSNLLLEIHTKRQVGEVLNVGSGLLRALYATYISALEPQSFTYPLIPKVDSRGSFVEVLKTPDAGQFSTFVARPGVTRGSHYHHSKVEKFVVVAGTARFRYRSINSQEQFETCVNAESPVVVESIPGWIHDVTNIGSQDLVVLVWANERFNVERPDTIPGVIE